MGTLKVTMPYGRPEDEWVLFTRHAPIEQDIDSLVKDDYLWLQVVRSRYAPSKGSNIWTLTMFSDSVLVPGKQNEKSQAGPYTEPKYRPIGLFILFETWSHVSRSKEDKGNKLRNVDLQLLNYIIHQIRMIQNMEVKVKSESGKTKWLFRMLREIKFHH
jgi:hypothetical protein